MTSPLFDGARRVFASREEGSGGGHGPSRLGDSRVGSHDGAYEDDEREALVGVGYSLDPEEHPGEKLVADPWSRPLEPGYEVELSFDPDALMFGAPRVWRLEIVTKDPRYPVGRRYEQELAAYEEDLRGETTQAAVATCTRFLGIMRRRHRLVARSEDGDREIWIEDGKDAVVKKKEPLHRAVANEDDFDAESAYADFSAGDAGSTEGEDHVDGE